MMKNRFGVLLILWLLLGGHVLAQNGRFTGFSDWVVYAKTEEVSFEYDKNHVKLTDGIITAWSHAISLSTNKIAYTIKYEFRCADLYYRVIEVREGSAPEPKKQPSTAFKPSQPKTAERRLSYRLCEQ